MQLLELKERVCGDRLRPTLALGVAACLLAALVAIFAVQLASVNGAGGWLRWLAVGALAVVGVIALFLGRRVMGSTARLQASLAELADSEERARLLIDGAVDYAIYMLDPDGRVTSWNRGAERLKGYAAEEIVGRHVSILFPGEDVRAGKPATELAVAVRDGHHETEGWRQRKDGTRFWANVVIAALSNPDGSLRGFAKVTRDVTERKRAEEQLLHDAMHDALTGLPNRALFTDRLTQALRRGKRHADHRCAVLFLDLDRFKLVNDSFTHETGDELLVAFAQRLSGCVRPGDTVARLSGDEFTILVEDIGSADEAVALAGRVQRTLETPFRIGARDLVVTASVGIAVSGRSATAAELMRNADIAMYDAKRRGKARSATFDADMHDRVVGQLQIETELHAAISGGHLRVFYQPIIDLTTGRLSGLEALVRWPSDEPAIGPDEFVPVAEESGLIGLLGSFVLSEACARLRDWRERGIVDDDVTVSVNVSRRQLTDSSLVDTVAAALTEAGLPPEALRLEITETAFIESSEVMHAVLSEIAELGVSAQIDDFGMGYSSLAFLRQFPGDTVKIDRSYIASMHEDEASAAIVRAIVELAKNLGAHTIAEGVEHPEQVEALLALGCESAQGFLFSKPLPMHSIEPLIRFWDPDKAINTSSSR